MKASFNIHTIESLLTPSLQTKMHLPTYSKLQVTITLTQQNLSLHTI